MVSSLFSKSIRRGEQSTVAMRGKLFGRLVVIVAALFVAALLAGFNGCEQKPSGGADSSASRDETGTTTEETKTPAELETKPAAGKMFVTLYFSDASAEKLVREKREIRKTPAVARAIISELIKGPMDPGLYPTLPRQLKVRGVKTKGTIAIVDLSNVRAAGYGGTAAEMMLVYSIVNSLTELPGIKAVDFRVDGKRREVLLDAFETTDPVARDERLIRK